jgi:hypothetical protein
MPISHYNCKYRSLLICLASGIVLFIYGLSNLPDPGTRTTVGSDSEQPNNQTIIVNSDQFKMSMGGLGVAVLSLILFAKLNSDRDIEEVEEEERRARLAHVIVRVEPEPTPLKEKKKEPMPLQEPMPLAKPELKPDIKPKETRVTFKEPLPRGPSIMYLPRPWLPPNYQYRHVAYPSVIPYPRPVINVRPPSQYVH